MTRALPSQPSPQFLTYDIFTGDTQADLALTPYTPLAIPLAETPSQCTRSKDIVIIPSKPPSRPTYAKMIEQAVFENSVSRKGASLSSIKKYLQNVYGLDVKKPVVAKRICKCIRESAGIGGHLKQKTGTGAQGSFILQKDIRDKLQVKKERKERSLSKSANNTPAMKVNKINTVQKKAAEKKKQRPSKPKSDSVLRIRVTEMKKPSEPKADTVPKKNAIEMKRQRALKDKTDNRPSRTPVTRMRVD